MQRRAPLISMMRNDVIVVQRDRDGRAPTVVVLDFLDRFNLSSSPHINGL